MALGAAFKTVEEDQQRRSGRAVEMVHVDEVAIRRWPAFAPQFDGGGFDPPGPRGLGAGGPSRVRGAALRCGFSRWGWAALCCAFHTGTVLCTSFHAVLVLCPTVGSNMLASTVQTLPGLAATWHNWHPTASLGACPVRRINMCTPARTVHAALQARPILLPTKPAHPPSPHLRCVDMHQPPLLYSPHHLPSCHLLPMPRQCRVCGEAQDLLLLPAQRGPGGGQLQRRTKDAHVPRQVKQQNIEYDVRRTDSRRLH